MREKYYGLLKEYLATIRECDLCEQQIRSAQEEVEREEAALRTELVRKRCAALRRQIRSYPVFSQTPPAKRVA
jgi:hypothetical protein